MSFNDSGTVTTFCDFLKALRQQRGMTLGQLALRSGTGKATLSRWESGTSAPRLPELSRVFDALETPGGVRAQGLRLLQVPRALTAARRDEQATAHFSLGDMLFALRQRSGKTQAEAARGAGVSRSAYAYWESDANQPTTHQLHATAFALGASGDEAVALTARSFAETPIEKNRDVLLNRYDDVILIWNFASEAEYRLHLLTLLANFGFLLRRGKADVADVALIANAFAEGIAYWHGEEHAHGDYRRARHLAGQAQQPLHRHLVFAMQDQIDETLPPAPPSLVPPPIPKAALDDLWSWLPALSDNAGRALLLSFVARQMAPAAPAEALRLGDRYCRLVDDNEAEHECRKRDYANLLRLCGRPAESVAYLAALTPQDEFRAGLLQMDMAHGLLAQTAYREASTCLTAAKQILVPRNIAKLTQALTQMEHHLEKAL